MYIRQISRLNKDGTRVRYLQLAHKVRDPVTGKPRDQILCHLGREDRIDKAQLRRLIRSLSRFLDPADRVQVNAELAGLGKELVAERDLAYGGAYVLEAIWRRLKLDKVLEGLLSARRYEIDLERLIFALVASRALAPCSKLALERWVGRKVHIEGLPEVSVHALYRAMDFLVEHAEEIQREVFFSTASLLNLEVDLLFFDTTTTYFEIEEEDEFRRYGHSKDHRGDLPQIVIGLAVTKEGIPVRCWAWPGSTCDASVVEEVQGDLSGWRLNRVVWVVDRGMAGREQRIAFRRGGGHLIVGEKLRGGEVEVREALSRGGRYRVVRDGLEVKEIKVENGSELRRFVLVRNPKEAARDRKRRERILAELSAELERLNRGLPKRGKEHTRAVCALKSHPVYGKYVRELPTGELVIDRGVVRREERLDGKYLLSTTDPGLTAEEVALGYRQLLEVERAFRTLKHTLELRPLYHRLPERIRAHVLLCWLALLLVRVMERMAGESWGRMREELEELRLVTLRTVEGTVQVVTEPTAAQRKILASLSIPLPRRVKCLELDSRSV